MPEVRMTGTEAGAGIKTGAGAEAKIESGTESAGARHWVGAWSIAHTSLFRLPVGFDNQTFRTVVQLNLPGSALRVRVSNRYGREAVQIGAAAVSHAGADGILAGDTVPLLFDGVPWIRLAPGEERFSDAASLETFPGCRIAVDLHYPGRGRFISGNVFPAWHKASETGLHVGERHFPTRDGFRVRRLQNRILPATIGILAGVDVHAPTSCRAVVAFGDSITALNQWTSVLAERLLVEMPGVLSLLNQGIRGNRLLHAADSGFGKGIYGPAGILRFERDALAQSGVATVISLIGVNDLLQPGLTAPREQEQDAESLVNGMRGLIHLAHEKGVRILGGTIMPFGGYLLALTPEREAVRQAVNGWIRQGGEFDGVIDFDLAVRNPVSPERLTDHWHVGDRLHPNAQGGRVMASVIHPRFLVE